MKTGKKSGTKKNNLKKINMQIKRNSIGYRSREKVLDKNAKRILRENEEYRVKENLANKKAMIKLREDVEYRDKENDITKNLKRKLRADAEYREKENLVNKNAMIKLREDVEYRDKENDITKNLKRKLRADAEYREKENLVNKKAMIKLREDVEYREKENDITKNLKRKLRADAEYREKQNLVNKNAMIKLREDVEYREKENDITKNLKRKLRADAEYREKENLVNKKAMIKLREDVEYREKEKEINRNKKTKLREDDKYCEKANEIDKKSKKRKMELDFFHHRKLFYNSLMRNSTQQAKLQLQFIKYRSSMPKIVCCCCEGLFFEHSVVCYDNEKILQLMGQDYEKIYNFVSSYICKTCLNYINRAQIPKLATSNGLKFTKVPKCIEILTPLEERMVSPYINFMQIRPLKEYAVNPQLGMKGSVVNIPIEINDILKILPRNFDNMATMQIKLKRHSLHATDYMYETIRPAVVCDALKFLVHTPLYEKHEIQINATYMEEFKMCNVPLDFIINGDDVNELDETINNNHLDENVIESDEEQTDEVLLIDRNQELANNIKIIAPGQSNRPVPWHLIEDIDELCFPKLFVGHAFNQQSVTYAERAKSEIRRRDRRSCNTTRILFMAKKKLEQTCISSLNICLRKTKGNNTLSAKNALNIDMVNHLTKIDLGYKMLKQVRSSPAYWESRKKDLMAMIRQLGKPTFFLTISAAEKNWPELIKALANLNYNQNITVEKAFLMEDFEKMDLIRKDPVTCARYFDYKVFKLMQILKSKNSIFEEFEVEDSYERVEFQMRGSPHEHIFLWLKNAPKYDSTNSNSVQECINFIDRFITCENDFSNPYVRYQKHKHTHTCYKGKRNKQKCRFNYPIPVMERTVILEPLRDDKKENSEHSEILKRIRKLMIYFSKKQELLSFKDILAKLEVTEQQYILALRSSLKRPQVYLKRSSLEVTTNAYNKLILQLFESNMDLQFVVEEYGIASYIINYVGKVDAGLSKLLRDAASDIQSGNRSLKDKFNKIANVFLNGNLMSAQEAVYHLLSMPLSKSSRQTIFINTSPVNERVLMLKTNRDLKKLDENSTDIFMENHMIKYSKRPANMEKICLADFVATFRKKNRKINHNENDDAEQEEDANYMERNKCSVIRYRRYKLIQDAPNYFREQLLLFMPWRNENTEVENVNHSLVYNNHIKVINENRIKYTIVEDEALDDALECAQNEYLEVEEENINSFIAEQLSPEQHINILEQAGKEISTKKVLNRFTCPPRISEADLMDKMENLNILQREFVFHVFNCFTTKTLPFRIFLSGSAGVGKTTVINCVFQLITNYLDNLPDGLEKGKLSVLLTAPSGKAAFLINGVTLHTAFCLPVSQFAGLMPELSSDIANSIREKLQHLKLLIIDEISMVGSTLFSRVDVRLRQIMGVNKSFGGVSVLVVGDLNQLPPVMDSLIFKISPRNEMSALFDKNPLWEEFKFYELTEIMRQKDEKRFIIALNNIARNTLTEEDSKLFTSRKVVESDIPVSAIRLFTDNANVDLFNQNKIDKFPGTEYLCVAKDVILGKIDNSSKQKILESLQKKKISEVNGLPHVLQLKIGIKYMITCNLDVEDGLVNGACGVLQHITTRDSESNMRVPSTVWIDFNSELVGNKARRSYNEYMTNENIDKKLTPIMKAAIQLNISNKLQFPIVRKQFPLTPAEAITIHKSQGQTYSKICIDFNKCKRLTRSMLYVALSRVTQLSGLYILGDFKKPTKTNNDEILKEINKLRSEKSLKLNYETLKNKKGITIIYQNILSLTKKINYIKKDLWYSRGDVLIFTETLASESEIILMPGYLEVFRSAKSNSSRGILCFAKPHVIVESIKHITKHSDVPHKWHIEFYSFIVGETLIITGYKSPATKNIIFTRCFEEVMSANNNNTKFTVLIGDFNFDVRSDSFLETSLKQYNLRSLLSKEATTTNLNTQVDIIFGNNVNMCAEVYETFFSYHRPIFVQLKNDTILTQFPVHSEIMNLVSSNDNDKLLLTEAANVESAASTNHKLLKATDAKNLSNKYLDVVLNNTGYLEDIHMDFFGEILSRCTNFTPQSVLLHQIPKNIKPNPTNRPNIQILYNQINNSAMGHWIYIIAVSWEEWWTYDGISGPAFWGLINPEWSLCNRGRRQSPVNLEPQRLLFDPNLRPVHIDKHRISGMISNTGHSVIFTVDNETVIQYGTSPQIPVNLTGGPLSYKYRFQEIHVHYGLHDQFGSEHSVEGYTFPAEIQLFGYNSQLYSNFSDALNRAQGIVGVSVLLQLGDLSNPELRMLTDQLEKIRYGGDEAPVRRISIRGLLPETDHYMTYEGSTTAPACHETVTWIVLNKPIYITKQQMHALRRLMQGSPDHPKAPLGNNFRPPQQLYHRPVRTNIDFRGKQNGKICPTMYRDVHYKANSWKQH